MGYRGSKSEFIVNSVKEQRVDGSWLLKKLAVPNRSLRCTLMGCENSYQVKIPAKQLQLQIMSRTYSTLSNKLIPCLCPKPKAAGKGMNPWFLTGFADAESSFIISIYRNEKSKLK